jgi:acylphosphatase
VQGVSYRAWTLAAAKTRDLAGWVRNCPDGSVEAVFSGPADKVDAMLTACFHGPPAAQVDKVETGPAGRPEAGDGFTIRS